MKIDYKRFNTNRLNNYCANLYNHNEYVYIPAEIANNQKEYDGKTFYAITQQGNRIRVRLNGDDYGLNTTGTGEIVVRLA